MKFEQVIQAIRDGRQVKIRGYDPIETSVWSGNKTLYLKDLLGDDWEIVPEHVDFAEAWKAYEEGKTIKSIPCDAEYWVTDGIVDAFTSEQIRGKWLILEDK